MSAKGFRTWKDDTNNTPKLEQGKYCYAIVESSKDENGYIPVIVIEDEAGYYPLSGRGEHAAPWYWGKTFDGAQGIADKANERLGIDKDRAAIIVSSSFVASRFNR